MPRITLGAATIAAVTAIAPALAGDIIQDPGTFDLYAIEYDGDLFGVNSANGHATFIGNVGMSAFAGLEFTPTGTLLCLDAGLAGTTFHKVSTTTATTGLVQGVTLPANVDQLFEGGFAFAPDGTVYASNTNSSGNAGLISLDLADGIATFIGTFGGTPRDINSLTFRDDGQLVGIDSYQNAFVRINTTTGKTTWLADIPNHIADSSGGMGTFDGKTAYVMDADGGLYALDLYSGAHYFIGTNGVAGGSQFNAIAGLAARPKPGPCPGDLNNDGKVDSLDLNIVLGEFGCTGDLVTPCAGDANADGDCDSDDLNIVLAAFGSFCDPPSGSCCVPQGTPGCESTLCMSIVCGFEPYCCQVEWDAFCAGLSAQMCFECTP